MYPPGSYAVGVSVASTVPGEFADELEGLVDRDPLPSRLGELLRVPDMTAAQIAGHLQGLQAVKAQLAAFEAELIDGLAARRPAHRDRKPGQAGSASPGWAAELLDAGVSEFFPDELALVLNSSRAHATSEWEICATLTRRLPAVQAALADGVLDKPRAWAIARELGWLARETPDGVLAEVAAAILPGATEVSIRRLRDRARAELIKRDPDAADRRRVKALRDADVTTRGLPDGMAELRAGMDAADAAEVRAKVDEEARWLKAQGDQRPIGMLRTLALHQLVTRPWEQRPAVTARLDVVATLDSLESAAAGAPGAGTEPATVDGWPVTPGQARVLLERLDALCPGGLQAPTGGSLLIAVVDGWGRQRAAVTRHELEQAVRRGEGLGPPPAIDRYEPTPAQDRFVSTRDRGCRQPGCPNRAGWADLDHVCAHAEGGQTTCTNLCCLCRRHHRLKTFADGWIYTMTDDGVLSVTTPSGVTRISRPPGLQDRASPGQADPDPPPF